MKGDSKIIEMLNKALTIELTAINQYFIQARMCHNWGYHKLGDKHQAESIGEMKHAQMLIDKILFLDGIPNIARYDVIHVGSDVKAQFENDLKLEMGGLTVYNQAIDLCLARKDAGSRELLERILTSSEEHVDWLESQLGIIEKIGIAIGFLYVLQAFERCLVLYLRWRFSCQSYSLCFSAGPISLGSRN